ncbi:MAG: hypothetical protein IKL40_04485 [Clostridia bacterium]|nr:hypothetical protein [Clostridia bacterium]
MENKGSFNYTYSAKEQNEIKRIRDKYVTSEVNKEDKMETLRRLDEGVTRKATVTSLVFGIVGALIMGIGMSLAMTDIGGIIGINSAFAMIIGVIIGIVGIVLVSVAYPVYNRIIKKEREKIAPEIIRLTDELMK